MTLELVILLFNSLLSYCRLIIFCLVLVIGKFLKNLEVVIPEKDLSSYRRKNVHLVKAVTQV